MLPHDMQSDDRTLITDRYNSIMLQNETAGDQGLQSACIEYITRWMDRGFRETRQNLNSVPEIDNVVL